jgi:group II intron maturase
VVYTWPSKNALAAAKVTVHALTRAGSNQPPAALLGHRNQVLRGWTAYFRHGVSKRTFDYRGLGKHCRPAKVVLVQAEWSARAGMADARVDRC